MLSIAIIDRPRAPTGLHRRADASMQRVWSARLWAAPTIKLHTYARGAGGPAGASAHTPTNFTPSPHIRSS